MNFFQRFKYSCLLRETKKFIYKKRFHNLHTAKKIGILFQCNEDTKAVIDEFISKLRKYKIEVITLCYQQNVEVKDNVADYVITKKELNFWGCPIKSKIKSFINTGFEILILASLENIYPLTYIFAISNAQLKVSPLYKEWNFADLTLKIREGETLDFFFSNIEKYLLEIQTKK